ncbi:uncharacterized protein BO96DRAFT_337226 [Aspergillus niger CBS 101883]|uniref:Uncharacterized protein n=2 Tax=Aspergillus niger TaxID=5061 RepID=A2QVL2_ASPNC|nr:uncharacterized protein BO96DRAFT_337226 [Aspergillus niger CBS 101883]XP_059604287.1 hypothetical protein An11g01820 [Aspergillus niger]PYH56630.1 hypothetical protein BO96DRAFT_337226 [Aspergillus niger CBS 101883]CAK45916.1 hypothetical protein An11g01820 [Aspergillus niger]
MFVIKRWTRLSKARMPISACSVRTRILFVGSNPRLIETSLRKGERGTYCVELREADCAPRNAPFMYATMLGWTPRLPMRRGSMLEQQKSKRETRKKPCDERDRQQWRGSGEAGNGRFHLLVSWVRDRLTLPDPVRRWYYTLIQMPVLPPQPNLNPIEPAVASLVFFLLPSFGRPSTHPFPSFGLRDDLCIPHDQSLSFAGGPRRNRIWRAIVSALQIPWRSAHDPINLSQFPWEAVVAHCFAVRTTHHHHHH